MELKFTKTLEDGTSQVVILTAKDTVKHGETKSNTHIMAQPYTKPYKQHASALKKFKEIVEAVINDND